MPKEVKQAIQTFKRDKNGDLVTTWIDIKTGKSVTNFKGYELLDTTEQQMKELTGQLPGEDKKDNKGVKPSVPSIPKVPVGGGKRGDPGYTTSGPQSQGEGGLFDRSESDNFGYIDKPGFMDFAGLIPGVAGTVAAGVNLGLNANNVAAINAARKSLGMEPLSTKETLKGAVKGVSKDVTKKGETKRGYGVALGGVMEDEKTGFTPQEARLREQADEREKVKQETKAALGLKTTAEAKSRLHPELSPDVPTKEKKSLGNPLGVGNKPKGLPAGLDMVKEPNGGSYRAKLASVNFDDFDLDPVAREKAKEFQKEALARNLDLAVDVTSMVRTPEQQKAIKASGASWTLKSEHMAGAALDVSPVDPNDQAGWQAKRELAESLGWGQLNPAKDPGHMGLTKSNTYPGATNVTKEEAIAARDYFGNVPALSSEANRKALGLGSFTPTPTARPGDDDIIASLDAPVGSSIVSEAKKPMSAQESFLADHYGYATAAGLTGVQRDLAVAQAALETGWGQVGQAVKGNNFHGMKVGTSWTGPSVNLPTQEEYTPGVMTTIKDNFRQYASPVESYKDWASKMATNWPGVTTAKTFDEAVSALDQGKYGKYATASAYGENLKDIGQKWGDYARDYYSQRNEEAGLKAAADLAKSSFGQGLGTAATRGVAQATDPSLDNMGRADSPSSGRSSFSGAGGIAGQRSERSSLGLGSGSSTYGGTRGGDPGRGPGSSAGPGRGTSPGSPGVGPGRGPGLGGPSLGGSKPSFGGTSAAFGKDSPSEGGSRFGGSGLGTPDKDKDKDSHGAKSGF